MMMVAVVVMVWLAFNDPSVLGVGVVSHYEDDDVWKDLGCVCERFQGLFSGCFLSVNCVVIL